MRIRKKSWEENELTTNEHLVHNPEDYKGKWNEYFGNNNPIYAEIGCGKGKFIVQNASENPDINFIGIERQTTIMAIAARKTNSEMKNIALIRGDAETLEDLFSPEELSRIYLNFSDPWPKKRWAKRRLTKACLKETKRYFLRRIIPFFLSHPSMNFVKRDGDCQIFLLTCITAAMKEIL